MRNIQNGTSSPLQSFDDLLCIVLIVSLTLRFCTSSRTKLTISVNSFYRLRFEPPEDHIAVGRIIFDQAGKPPRLLRGDHGRPGTAEGIEDDGAAPAVVLDRIGHEVDGFDGRV